MLDRRQFIGSLASLAVLPATGFTLRHAFSAPAPSRLPPGEIFSLGKEMDSPNFEMLAQLMGYFNSMPWRGEKRETVQMVGISFSPVGEGWTYETAFQARRWDFRFDFARKRMMRVMWLIDGCWQDLGSPYGTVDFNQWDFGEPIARVR